MPTVKYGRQAIKAAIIADGRTIRGFIRTLKSDQRHAVLAFDGNVPPSTELRAEVSNRLGMPVELLFTKAALDAEYRGPRGRVLV